MLESKLSRVPVLRSVLFVPGSNERRMRKALESAADGVVLDLEDAVATSEKATARDAIRKALALPRAGAAYVRINGLTTTYALQDVLAVIGPHLDGIVMPKAESSYEVRTLDWLLAQVEAERGLLRGSIGVIPIIETARGLERASEIASAATRLHRLAFGAIDLAADMELALEEDDTTIAAARFTVARASRAYGLDGPLDTAFIRVRDLEALRDSTLRARALGYSGKFCIHPDQIEVVNAIFTPTAEEVEKAERIVSAFEEAEAEGTAAIALDGVMLDYPVVERARRVLAAAILNRRS